jgi:hypothetical protein
MKDISNLLHTARKLAQRNCPEGCASGCKQPNTCSRMRVAEVWAYTEAVVPDQYRQFTIEHFTGMKDGKSLLKPQLVADAKEALVKYCWEGIEEGESFSPQWLHKSMMHKRRRQGNNLVIYGNPWSSEVSAGKVKTFRLPLGKTMLAAIVMKEAICLRMRGSEHYADSYAWVAYHTMVNRLMEQAKGNSDYDEDVWQYENADWLVVDGLEVMKDAGSNFRASVLDKLFGERLDKGLPSILVFQDDLSQCDNLRAEFGVSINSIINSPKTFCVALLDGKRRYGG